MTETGNNYTLVSKGKLRIYFWKVAWKMSREGVLQRRKSM